MASGSDENGDQQLKLYSYYMSSCAYRIRIALNLKGLKYEYKAVNLLKGEQFSPEFRKLNPIGYVPVLVDGDLAVSDSFAILLVSLIWKKSTHNIRCCRKAINFQAAIIVCSSIPPLVKLAVVNYIEERVSPDAKIEWVKVHIGKGFAALEDLLKNYAGRYAIGDEVTFLFKELGYWFCKPSFHSWALVFCFSEADLFLAPQIDAAFTRFNLDMTQFPLLSRLHEAYNEIPAFIDARPDKQPDATS